MQLLYNELMYSYQRLKERKYTILEQKKGGKYGNMPWAIPNAEWDKHKEPIVKMADAAEQRSLKMSDAPKEQVNQVYSPVLLAKDPSRVYWKNAEGGSHTANIDNFIGYIRSKQQETEEQGEADQAEAEAQQQAEEEALAPLPWMPSQLTQGQLEKVESLEGQIPGFGLQKTIENIFGDPNQGKGLVKQWFKLLYETPETRSMTPIVQSELANVMIKYAEISKKAVTQEDGRNVIDDKDLDDDERDILNASVCRSKKNGGLFFGRRGSGPTLGSVAPEFQSWTRALKQEFAEEQGSADNYSMAYKAGYGPGQALCAYFANTFIDKDGVESKAILSSGELGTNKAGQVLGTVKEHLMVGVMDVAFAGIESGKMEELVSNWQGFSQAMAQVCDRNDDTMMDIPTGGTLESEDSMQLYDQMVEATGIEDCGQLAKQYIKDSIKEGLAIAKTVRDAKVRPLQVSHKGKGSDSNDKTDIQIELASPEDTARLYSSLAEKGIDVTMDDNFNLSVKAYADFVGSELKAGTGSFQKNSRYVGGVNCDKVSPQFRGECVEVQAQQSKIRNEFETNPLFKDVPDKAKLVKGMDKAAKNDQWALTHVVDLCLNDKARKSAANSLKTVFEDTANPSTGPGRAAYLRVKKQINKLASMNKKDAGKFAVDFLKVLRHQQIAKSPDLERAYAANDAITAFMTASDEAITMVGGGKVSMTGVYQVLAHILTHGEARQNRNGNYSFYDPESGARWGGAAMREKADRIIIDSSISGKLIAALSKFLSEDKGGSDPLIESIYGKLDELLQSIHVAVAR